MQYKCPPVMMCGFARPDLLGEVFSRVRDARPEKLFLVLDAPRAGRDDDVEANARCREIFSNVDWPCEVHRNYATENMGCRTRMESAITWVFEHVDRAIILEDDCCPDPTFFRFCGELLEKYKDDDRVGMIGGSVENLHVDCLRRHGESYYFDRWASIWGWATWRRAWSRHDPQMSYFPELHDQFDVMYGFYRDWPTVRRRRQRLWNLFRRIDGAWDGAWFTTMLIQNWLCIHPYSNMVSNTGCGVSSRTSSGVLKRLFRYRSPWDRRPTVPMEFPLVHPLTMMPDVVAERHTLEDFGELHTWRWWITRFPYYCANAVLRWILGR